MKVLIVGIGSIGRRHLANVRKLVPNAEIAALRRQATRPEGVDRVFTRQQEALAFAPDVVFETGPARGRAEHARAFAERGAHLFLEKPMDVDLEAADALIDTCDRHGRTLMVGYVLRFDPTVRALRTALIEGKVGRLLSLRAEVGQALPDWHPGTDYRRSISAHEPLGGGAIFELSHELDLARWLGGPVTGVGAVHTNTGALEISVEDAAEIALRFGSRAIGSVHVDLLRRPSGRQIELIGDAGILRADLVRGTLRFVDPDGAERVLFRNLSDDRNGPYVAELEHFFACIRSQQPPLTNGRTGRAALSLALAARRAAANTEPLPA